MRILFAILFVSAGPLLLQWPNNTYLRQPAELQTKPVAGPVILPKLHRWMFLYLSLLPEAAMPTFHSSCRLCSLASLSWIPPCIFAWLATKALPSGCCPHLTSLAEAQPSTQGAHVDSTRDWGSALLVGPVDCDRASGAYIFRLWVAEFGQVTVSKHGDCDAAVARAAAEVFALLSCTKCFS